MRRGGIFGGIFEKQIKKIENPRGLQPVM